MKSVQVMAGAPALVLGALWLTLAAPEPAAPEPPVAQEQASSTTRLEMEENGGEVIEKLGEYEFPFGRFDLGVRAIVWRSCTRDGAAEPFVRFSFGFWSAGGFANLMGEGFQESVWWQLEPRDCEHISDLVDAMVGADFQQPGGHIKYRDVDGSYGDIRMRKFPNGEIRLFCWQEEGIGEIWLTIEPGRFKRFLGQTIATAERLESRPPSIAWN